jgi:hypothetical protein
MALSFCCGGIRRSVKLLPLGEEAGRNHWGGSEMETIVPILVQLIAGAAGGNVIGQVIKRLNLGPVGNSIAGAIGGLAATWLASKAPGLDGLVGMAGAAPAAGLDGGALAGQAVTGLVGGGVLSAIVGAIKSSMAKAS